jgi:hypothetical protein
VRVIIDAASVDNGMTRRSLSVQEIQRRGREALAQDLDWLAQASGPRFVCGDVRHLWNEGE